MHPLSQMFDSLGERVSELKGFSLWEKHFYVRLDPNLDQNVTGNKLWKLYSLYQHRNEYSSLVSYGGAQSNALRALAYFSTVYNKKCYYFVSKLPEKKCIHPASNLVYAQAAGVIIKECKTVDLREASLEFFSKHSSHKDPWRFVEQGVGDRGAKEGLERLANELQKEVDHLAIDKGKLCLCLPAGTGVSAFYLQQALNIPVVCVSCVGSKESLLKRFEDMNEGSAQLPLVIDTKKKYALGKLYLEFFELYKQMKGEVNIEFDLLYDMKMLTAIHDNITKLPPHIVYVHCGGIEGNVSMLARYQRKFCR
ncbi:MAG: hypothetical protein L7U87_06850 [Chlamydiales bacterium]|nr:hypothetical protein [Chlamydiales bacterium]